MRRILALMAGVVLVGALASSSLAATPTSANRFVGLFDMVDWDLTTVVGHVVVNITEPSAKQPVPGTLAIYWPAGSQVRESHAQLTWAAFFESTWQDPYSPTGWFHAIEVMAQGSMCDYRGPWDADCQPFAVMFQHITQYGGETADKVGFSVPGSTVCCDGPWYPAAKSGAWVLTYLGPTTY